jgi:hypothetical protein
MASICYVATENCAVVFIFALSRIELQSNGWTERAKNSIDVRFYTSQSFQLRPKTIPNSTQMTHKSL